MKIRIPYINTSIEEDLILSLFLVPLWWVLGVSLLIYHLIAVWLTIKLLIISAKYKRQIHIPKLALFLFLLILIYGLSLLLNLPFNPLQRTAAALYNYSFWIMGLLLIIVVYNVLSTEGILSILTAFKFNIIIVGSLSTLGLYLWFNGHQKVEFPSLLLIVFKFLQKIHIVKGTAMLTLVHTDATFFSFPRCSSIALYPVAVTTIIVLMLPSLLAYYRIKSGKIGLRHWGVIGLGIVALLSGASRTAIMALLMATTGVYILNRKHRAAIIALLLLVCLISLPFVVEAFQWVNDLRGASSSLRVRMYKYTINTALKENPVLGVGVKPWRDFQGTFVKDGVPMPVNFHSTYTGLFLRTGASGLLMFILFQGHILWSWVKTRKLLMPKTKRILWSHIGVSLIAMSLCLFTMDLDSAQLVAFLYFLLIGIMSALNKDIRRKYAVS